MKRPICLVFLLGIVFSAAEVTDSPDVTLYQIYTDPSMSRFQMQPGLRFHELLTLSTDSRVLSPGVSASDLRDGSVICEGNVNANFDVDGEWGHGFSAYVNYWQLCTPPGHSSTRSGPVFWSRSSYDAYEPIADCYSTLPGCWGREGSLVNERVTYEYTARTYPNSLGQSNVVCKGVASLYRGSVLLRSREIDGNPVAHSVAVARGDYTFSGNAQVNGCAGIVRIPVCSPGDEQVEEIFSSTTLGSSPRPYTRSLPPATLTIRVVSNEDLRCQAEFVSVTPSPLNVSPGGAQEITLNFRNPCPASDPLCQNATIGRITVSNGFTFTQGVALPGGNTVAPGRTRSIVGTLRAPAYTECPTQLTFTAEYSCPGCVGQIGGTPATVTIPFDCPTITRELPNLVPRFDPDVPSRVDIPTGEQPDFSIITWNRGTNTSNPGDTCVDIGRWMPSGTFMPRWESIASFRYPYPALAPGGEQPHGRLDFACTPEMENQTFTMLVMADCGYTTQECPNPLERCPAELDNLEERYLRCVPIYRPPPGEETMECELTPSSYPNGVAGETYEFYLACPEEGDADAVCGGDVDWEVNEFENATYEDYSLNSVGGWVKIADDSGAGEVHVKAEVKYADGTNATCSSKIVIPYIPCVEYI